jgi:class 3 adenylate cyclase
MVGTVTTSGGSGEEHWWRQSLRFGLPPRVLDARRSRPEPATRSHGERILTTLLLTDIVASTERMVALGDQRWRQLLDAHDAMVRSQIERQRGRFVKTTGDGVLAMFDGPTHAIRCASAIQERGRQLGMAIRAGLHTGEVEMRGADVTGIAVHVVVRLTALAQEADVLVSRTVTELVAGSGIRFVERGTHALKGVTGEWQIFAVV